MDKHLNLLKFQKTRLTFAGGVVEDDLFASDDERLSLKEFSTKKREETDVNERHQKTLKVTVRSRQKLINESCAALNFLPTK